MTQPNEFVLVKDANGKHFEEFCDEGGIPADIVNRAKAGTLGGHVPQSGFRYAFRGYFYKSRTLVKLTHRRIKGPRR
jgi:hypothetical protein